MLRRCVWSRNIKNRCSIYIYNVRLLRVKLQFAPVHECTPLEAVSLSKHSWSAYICTVVSSLILLLTPLWYEYYSAITTSHRLSSNLRSFAFQFLVAATMGCVFLSYQRHSGTVAGAVANRFLVLPELDTGVYCGRAHFLITCAYKLCFWLCRSRYLFFLWQTMFQLYRSSNRASSSHNRGIVVFPLTNLTCTVPFAWRNQLGNNRRLFC